MWKYKHKASGRYTWFISGKWIYCLIHSQTCYTKESRTKPPFPTFCYSCTYSYGQCLSLTSVIVLTMCWYLTLRSRLQQSHSIPVWRLLTNATEMKRCCLAFSQSTWNAATCVAGCLTLGGWISLMVAKIKGRRFATICSNFRAPPHTRTHTSTNTQPSLIFQTFKRTHIEKSHPSLHVNSIHFDAGPVFDQFSVIWLKLKG